MTSSSSDRHRAAQATAKASRKASRDAARHAKAAPTPAAPKPHAATRWSQSVTEHSDALDLQPGVFTQASPKKIAQSLKASAEHSERRKASPFRSAMSMLNFYLNRGGDTVSDTQRGRLERAKDELRRLFNRPVKPSHR